MPARLTSRELLDRKMTGEELNRTLVEAAIRTGWLVHHSRPCHNEQGRWRTALQGTPGLPDLILCRYPELLFWETKREVGEKLSGDQERWRDHLESTAQDQAKLNDALLEWPLHQIGITDIPRIEYAIIRPSDREAAVARLSRSRR